MVDRSNWIGGPVTEKAGKGSGIDQRLSRLARDTARLSALTLLNEQAASVAEVAGYLGVSRSTAQRHLEQMLDAGLIEVAEVAGQGEGSKPRFRALKRVLWDDEEWAALGKEERQRLFAWIVQMINSDVGEAIASGTYNSRTDAHASRMAPQLDEQGWQELTKLHREALEESFTIQAAAAERLAESQQEGFPVLSAMICCELPPGSKTVN
jgi:predicted ArsR family transcriptional regulator